MPEIESPIEPVFRTMFQLVVSILEEFPQLEQLCEATTRLLKHCIRIVPQTFQGNLNDYLKLLISNFRQFPSSAIIYSLVAIFKEYKDDPSMDKVFEEVYEIVLTRCYDLLSSTQVMNNEPLLTEDYFILSKQYLLNKKNTFLNTHVDKMVTLLRRGIGLTTPEAAESHAKVFKELLSTFRFDYKGTLRLRCVPMAIGLNS